jgi:hypothetical protein
MEWSSRVQSDDKLQLASLSFGVLHDDLNRNANRSFSMKASFEALKPLVVQKRRKQGGVRRIYGNATLQPGRLSLSWRILAIFTAWVWMQASCSTARSTARPARTIRPSSPLKFILCAAEMTCSDRLRCICTHWLTHIHVLLALFAVVVLLYSRQARTTHHRRVHAQWYRGADCRC